MNERIRELADQILPNEREFNKGDPKDWGYFFSGEELEKFAQLIVEECRNVLSDEYRKTPLECCGHFLRADEAMAKHFYGVEE